MRSSFFESQTSCLSRSELPLRLLPLAPAVHLRLQLSSSPKRDEQIVRYLVPIQFCETSHLVVSVLEECRVFDVGIKSSNR